MPQEGPPQELLATIANLARFHRQHEQFYSQAPLNSAVDVQAHSRVLKALALHWAEIEPETEAAASPFAGAEDLNPPGLVAERGVLFMEGGGEPAEIVALRRDLSSAATELEATAKWLGDAMTASWQVVGSLAEYPGLADVLGERHRIVANDWQSSSLQALCARLLERAEELLEHVDFSPAAVRADLAGPREACRYLLSASELLDRAADLLAESAVLVHDNERRWRTFSARVRELEAQGGDEPGDG